MADTVQACDDLNHRDYIDTLVRGTISCVIEILETADASVFEQPLTDVLRPARDRLDEVLAARAAPSEQEVSHG